jgi:hypothetical protein
MAFNVICSIGGMGQVLFASQNRPSKSFAFARLEQRLPNLSGVVRALEARVRPSNRRESRWNS